jgi:hypothetical protein
MVVGEYSSLDGKKFLTASLVDVKTGATLKMITSRLKGSSADEIADQFASTDLTDAGRHSPPPEPAATAVPVEPTPSPILPPPTQAVEPAHAQSEQASPPPATSPAVRPKVTVDPNMERLNTGITLSYPGVGLRFFPFNYWALDIGAQYEPGDTTALVAGIRVSRYFHLGGSLYPYLGYGIDYVRYTSAFTAGTGGLQEVYLGAELFLTPSFSLQSDAGVAMVMLVAPQGDASVMEFDAVVNVCLTYYFTGHPSTTDGSAR